MGLGFKAKQQVKMLSQNVYLPAVYEMHRSEKIEPGLVLFADAHHDRRPEAMELLYRKLRQMEEEGAPLHICQMYMDFGKASAKQVFDFSTQFMKVYARTAAVVICDNFLPVAACGKKEGTLVVQLWHGCGCYKKFGYDAQDDIPEGYRGDVFRNMDLVTVSAEAAVRPFCSAMHKDAGQVRALGVSRTDLYFSRKWREWCLGGFGKKYPGAHNRKVVLWAPTFRGNASKAELVDLNVEKLQRELGDGYLVITRLHPHMKGARQAQAFACPIATEQLYPVVDVLIADYSSLIYEYLLVARIQREAGEKEDAGGIVLYAPDLEDYEKKRGFYMNISEIPGEVVRSEEKLADAVRRAAGDDKTAAGADKTAAGADKTAAGADKTAAGADKTEEGADKTEEGTDKTAEKAGLGAFLDRYMSACDGHATERIAERIWEHCDAAKR